MGKDCVTDITFAEVRALVKQSGDSRLLEQADVFIGAALVVGAAATGIVGLLALLGPKNELFNIGKRLVRKVTGRRDEDFLGRYHRMAAAHQLLVYTGFFGAAEDVLSIVRPARRLSAAEKQALAMKACTWLQSDAAEVIDAVAGTSGVASAMGLPHPTEGLAARRHQLTQLYAHLADSLRRVLVGVEAVQSADAQIRERVDARLRDLPARAVQSYEAQYFALAADHPQFLTWLHLREHHLTSVEFAGLSTAVQQQLEEARAADKTLDVGLAHLGRRVDALPVITRRERSQRVIDGLSRKYQAGISERIIDDRFQTEPGEAELAYPEKAVAFVPQAFKVLRVGRPGARTLRLEDEGLWHETETREDLGGFFLSYYPG